MPARWLTPRGVNSALSMAHRSYCDVCIGMPRTNTIHARVLPLQKPDTPSGESCRQSVSHWSVPGEPCGVKVGMHYSHLSAGGCTTTLWHASPLESRLRAVAPRFRGYARSAVQKQIQCSTVSGSARGAGMSDSKFFPRTSSKLRWRRGRTTPASTEGGGP